MALDMMLEIEGQSPDWAAVFRAAEATGVYDHSFVAGESFTGFFQRSHMYFWLGRLEHTCHPIRAEGNHQCNFNTRCTLCFRVNHSLYDETGEDINEFLVNLSSYSAMRYVLSYEFENILAVNCHGRHESFWDTPHEPNWRPVEPQEFVPSLPSKAYRWLSKRIGLGLGKHR